MLVKKSQIHSRKHLKMWLKLEIKWIALIESNLRTYSSVWVLFESNLYLGLICCSLLLSNVFNTNKAKSLLDFISVIKSKKQEIAANFQITSDLWKKRQTLNSDDLSLSEVHYKNCREIIKIIFRQQKVILKRKS